MKRGIATNASKDSALKAHFAQDKQHLFVLLLPQQEQEVTAKNLTKHLPLLRHTYTTPPLQEQEANISLPQSFSSNIIMYVSQQNLAHEK